MHILKEYSSVEFTVKNSRFLTEAFPVSSQQEARSILKMQKQKYADARHIVHAFVIGETGGILGCSDDGEPSGTAGKPALAVLKGINITNIMITITRWFGGTLLGTGGLVKAYGDSAKLILQNVYTEELIQKVKFCIDCSYPEFEFIKRRLEDFSAEPENPQFTDRVKIKGSIPAEKKEALSAFIKNATKGGKTQFTV